MKKILLLVGLCPALVFGQAKNINGTPVNIGLANGTTKAIFDANAQSTRTTDSPTFVTVTAALAGNATTATTATNVSGIVAVANGGTGAGTFTSGRLLEAKGTSPFSTVAPSFGIVISTGLLQLDPTYLPTFESLTITASTLGDGVAVQNGGQIGTITGSMYCASAGSGTPGFQTSGITLAPCTVSQLGNPVANSGAVATVTDATLTVAAGLGLVVTGGGTNFSPVYCDGTNWRQF